MDVWRPRTSATGHQANYDRRERSELSRGSSSVAGGDTDGETGKEENLGDGRLNTETDEGDRERGMLLAYLHGEKKGEGDMGLQMAAMMEMNAGEGVEDTKLASVIGDDLTIRSIGGGSGMCNLKALMAVPRDTGVGKPAVEMVGLGESHSNLAAMEDGFGDVSLGDRAVEMVESGKNVARVV